METIKIHAIGNTWMATHSDPEIKTLFGTNTIPTPFTARTDLKTVVDSIRKLNPGYFVS